MDALGRAQLNHPSAVQASAIPSILTHRDVVMAAETGSGKTQAYLVPVFQKLRKRNQGKKEIEKESLGQTHTSVLHQFALVLCPNAMLCEQVAQMANVLCDGFGLPLLKVSVVSGGQGWPIAPPDVVVATPAALLNNLFAYDPRRRRRNAFLRDVKCVVFDEADMLLSGGFENQVIRLLNMFRLEEKQVSKVMQGESAIDSKDVRPWTDFEPAESTLEDELAVENEEGCHGQDENHETELCTVEAETSSKSEQNRKKDWLRSRKTYARSKQYVFAAATLPENGKKTPGAVLKRLFPEAIWVNGLFLHRHNPRLHKNWVEVDENTKVEALINAISNSSADSESSPKKALIFANSVEAVDAICRVLKRAEIECLCYHREIPSEERMHSLKVFQERGGVLVCTDSAARGLDIPNIGHVIQAEFAKSAIEFLHRIGRTARAGHTGTVTSLYTKANGPLVEAIKQAEGAGQPVEGSFSRKRSFRNKLKKAEMSSPHGM